MDNELSVDREGERLVLKYTTHVVDAYPCAKECEEILSRLDLLKDVLLNKVSSYTFTIDCEKIFDKYKELWFKFQDLIHEIYDTTNLTLWTLNDLGRFTLYETELSTDDVYFVESFKKKDKTITIFNIDELKTLDKKVAI